MVISESMFKVGKNLVSVMANIGEIHTSFFMRHFLSSAKELKLHFGTLAHYKNSTGTTGQTYDNFYSIPKYIFEILIF